MNTAQLQDPPATGSRQPEPRKRVRAYLGEYLISEYTAPAALAERYLAAVRPTFKGLEWKVDDLPPEEPDGRPLPAQLLWEVAP